KAKPTRKPSSPVPRSDDTEGPRAAAGDQPKGLTMKANKETFETRSAKGAEFARKGYDRMLGATRDQLEQAQVAAFKAYEDFSSFQKENYEAYVAASRILAKGAESFGKSWMTFTQDTMEHAAQTAKALLGAKTLREAADLQSEFVKANFDKLLAEGTKLSEL